MINNCIERDPRNLTYSSHKTLGNDIITRKLECNCRMIENIVIMARRTKYIITRYRITYYTYTYVGMQCLSIIIYAYQPFFYIEIKICLRDFQYIISNLLKKNLKNDKNIQVCV